MTMIKRNGLDRKWPRMKSGHFTTNKKYIKQNLHIEDLAKFNEIRTFPKHDKAYVIYTW